MNLNKFKKPKKQKRDKLCIKCSVRGKCCHVSFPIKGHNIILENVPCPHLDVVSGFCREYENRDKHPWCLQGDNIFEKGALPKQCLYLKDHPEREPKPAEFILDVIQDLPMNEQQEIVNIFNNYNNIPFMEYLNITIKNEVKS